MSNDLYSAKNLVGGGTYAKFENVGDKVDGVYVDRTVMFNTLKNCNNAVYHLRKEDGSIVYVQGKMKLKDKPEQTEHVLPELEAMEFGYVVGVHYAESKPATKPGWNPTKILKVYKGEFKPGVLAEYKGTPTTDVVKLADDSDFREIEKLI